jgi:hypothetical protein
VIGYLKINRAIATRYDQLADSFLGMLYITPACYWFKFVHAAGSRRLVEAPRRRRSFSLKRATLVPTWGIMCWRRRGSP